MKRNYWITMVTILVLLAAFILPACGSPAAPAPTTQAPAPTTQATTSAPKPTQVQSSPTATAPAGPAIKLRLATAHPPVSVPVELAKLYTDKVAAASNGRITIEIYPGAELFGHQDVPNVIPSGAIEMMITEAGHWVGTVGEIFNYQQNFFLMPDVEFFKKGRQTYGQIMDKIWQEYNTKYLWVQYRGTVTVINSKKLIKVPEDLRGLSIRSPTPAGRESVAAAGGTGVALAVDEVYDALDKGTLDGALTGTESVWSRGFWEVAKYNTGPLNIELWPIVMNLDAWNSLSPDDQQIMLKAGAEVEEFSIQESERIDQDAITNIRKAGSEYHVLTPEETAKWIEVMTPLHDQYVQKSKDEGHEEEVLALRRGFGDTRY